MTSLSLEFPSCSGFAVIDGYVVKIDPSAKQKHRVYATNPFQFRMAKAIRMFLKTQNLKNIYEYYKEPGDLFSCTSKTLFEVVPCIVVSFYWDEGVFKCCTRCAMPRDPITNAKIPLYSLNVIPLYYSKVGRKFLVYVPAHLEQMRPQLHFKTIPLLGDEVARPSPYQNQELASEKLNTILKNVFMADTFHFDNRSDSKILERLHIVRQHYKDECRQIFTKAYQLTMTQQNSRYMRPANFYSRKAVSLVRRYKATTIGGYASRFANSYFLLLHAHELSFFVYPNKEYLSERLQPLRIIEDMPFSMEKLKAVSAFSRDMLSDRDGLAALIETLVKLMAFNFSESVDNDEKLFKPELSSINMLRSSLDALKFFLINTALCYDDGGETLPFGRKLEERSALHSTNIWLYVNEVYNKVVQERMVISKYRVTLKRPEGVAVGAKVLDRQKIRNFYKTMRMQFDDFLWKLREYFRLPSVDDLAVDLLHCSDISLMESRFEPKGSLLDLFPAEYLQSLLPMFNRYEALSEEQLNEILEIIDKMVEPLIWMVYFGCGYSYRFPELVAITYAGRDRSIFIDEETKCLILFTTYNKNESFQPLTKRLDATTSKFHLLYYIVILRQIQVNLLGPEYSMEKRDDWPDFQGTATELSQFVLHRYVFVITGRERLYRQDRYNSTLLKGIGLNTQELRQAMVAIMRNYVKCDSTASEVFHSMTQELMFGHSIRTGLENYGLDNFSFGSITASTATHFQSVASTSWHKWIGFDPEFRSPPTINGFPTDDTIKELEGYVETLKTALENIRNCPATKQLHKLQAAAPAVGLSGYMARRKAARVGIADAISIHDLSSMGDWPELAQ
ncbi:LAFA_0B08460g1_1 [Lachancea sp. 'fantastica']|nr:LAFA_0B08460g1_1 [Lachancea sp. 'fantastica']